MLLFLYSFFQLHGSSGVPRTDFNSSPRKPRTPNALVFKILFGKSSLQLRRTRQREVPGRPLRGGGEELRQGTLQVHPLDQGRAQAAGHPRIAEGPRGKPEQQVHFGSVSAWSKN